MGRAERAGREERELRELREGQATETCTPGHEKPLRVLAVAEDAPAGVMTGRVGAGLNGPGLPRDEARFSSRRLGRNPPSGRPASLTKTPQCGGVVAPRDEFR